MFYTTILDRQKTYIFFILTTYRCKSVSIISHLRERYYSWIANRLISKTDNVKDCFRRRIAYTYVCRCADSRIAELLGDCIKETYGLNTSVDSIIYDCDKLENKEVPHVRVLYKVGIDNGWIIHLKQDVWIESCNCPNN